MVELTTDILKRNGFERLVELGHEYFRSPDGRVCISDEANRAGCNWYVHVDDEYFRTIGSFDFQYIEDLNAFLALCGLDLRIQ